MAGTIEVISSPEWIAEMRERLADMSRRHERSIESSAIENQLNLQIELARASMGLFEELPKAGKPKKATKKKGDIIGGVEINQTTQRHTRSYSLGSNPEPELQELGSFARVVELKLERHGKHIGVPAILGGVSLGEKLSSSTHFGLEFDSPSPYDLGLLVPGAGHRYSTVDVDISSGWYPGYEDITALVEGLHAVAVSSQLEPGVQDLPEPNVFA